MFNGFFRVNNLQNRYYINPEDRFSSFWSSENSILKYKKNMGQESSIWVGFSYFLSLGLKGHQRAA